MEEIIWSEYNPSWLVAEAQKVASQFPWLSDSFRECTQVYKKNDYYFYFIDPSNPNSDSSNWKFQQSTSLFDTPYGHIEVDILEGNIVGGIEFYSKLFNE